VREEDTVARLGGDEFAVVVRPLSDTTEAAAVAGKLIEALHEPISIADHAFYLTASIGISLLPQDGHDAQSLLRNADAAMYRAKEQGRNTHCFYTQEMTEQARERVSLVASLREGLEREELFVHYQPLVDLGTQRVVGVEALVRWKHPTRGLVPPDRFIGLAEERGVIYAIGELVLKQACAQMVAWRESGLELGVVSINLSGKQIQRGDTVDTIRRILAATDKLSLTPPASQLFAAPPSGARWFSAPRGRRTRWFASIG
jgi:predicted signal transduction protein with EAL and GGDEF domain